MIPPAFRGPLWMVGAAGFITAVVVGARIVSDRIPPFEIVFFRNVFCLMFMTPALLRSGWGGLRTRRHWTHALRALTGLLAMFCWFTAVTLMPIAEVTALSFLSPIFATIGAAVFLGETVRLRRWIATLIGFAGALIVLRPGVQVIGTPSLLALGAAFFMASSMLTVKALSRTESATTILVYQMLYLVPVSAVPAAFVWVAPPVEIWPMFVGIGFVATLGQVCIVRAFAASDASAVMPFDYSRLIFAAALGFFLFSEVPDPWTWVGATVIFGAGLYIARRESERKTPPPPHGDV